MLIESLECNQDSPRKLLDSSAFASLKGKARKAAKDFSGISHKIPLHSPVLADTQRRGLTSEELFIRVSFWTKTTGNCNNFASQSVRGASKILKLITARETLPRGQSSAGFAGTEGATKSDF